MDRIISNPNVYISNIRDVQESSFNVDRVITVCQDTVEDNVGCKYNWFNISDGPDNKYGGNHDYESFSEAVDCVLNSLNNNEDIIVHCHKGQSRSASITIAALAVYKNKTYDETYEFVESIRPQIDPDGLLEEHAKNYVQNKKCNKTFNN